MLRYTLQRLLSLIPTIIGITLVVFLLFRLVADPAEAILGLHGTEAAKEALRRSLGLYDPLYIQYWRFLNSLLHGDLGMSWYLKRPVAELVLGHFPHTIELTFAAMIITAIGGIATGIISAIRHQTWIDYASMMVSLIAVSMPIFWLGLVVIGIFGVQLHWFPLNGRMTPTLLADVHFPTGFYIFYSLFTGKWKILWDLLDHLVLPSVVLASATTALVARITRSTMLDVVRLDYVRTARAKGLAEKTVVFKHALKNAMIPVITVLGLQFGALLGGAVLTESIFSWPGMGSLTLQAIGNNDLPLIQGIVVLSATVFVLVNLAVDMSYGLLDPRIRYS
ncbi:MAG TPA: ABC transporter permease [Symbiobacteriaceae bacterium]|jgi:peptide/nickel transport system permease protein